MVNFYNSSKFYNSELIPKLVKKFSEINDLLYTTSIPNEVLEEKVLPYIADDVIFRDPWQEGGDKKLYSIGMQGFHNMLHFTFDTFQVSVQINGPDGSTGRCIVDGIMNLQQFSWIYTFPLRTIIVYDFRILDEGGPNGPNFEIFQHEEMWSYLELIQGVPGVGWAYKHLFRPAFGHLFVGISYLSIIIADFFKNANSRLKNS